MTTNDAKILETRFVTLAKENSVQEGLMRLMTLSLSAFGFLALVVTLMLIGWFVEYLLFEIEFLDWIYRRWFVPVGIIAVIAITKAHKRRRLQELLDGFYADSNPTSKICGLKPNSRFATGGIRINREIVGPITVSADSFGLCFWQKGRLQAGFDWDRIEKLYLIKNDSGTMSASLEIRRDTFPQTGEILIPWSQEMSRLIPSSTTSNKTRTA